MKQQSLNHQKGEVEFRRKLVRQQLEGGYSSGEGSLKDEFTGSQMENILRKRMTKTLQQMTGLRARGHVLFPFLEIGAERCQRSLVMRNDLGGEGFSADISFDALRSAEHYAKLFRKEHLPFRVCCDANQLPFRNGSLPFVFCYETLHHFPTPLPVVREIHRVLEPGGRFMFEEEPYRKIARFRFYRIASAYSEQVRARSRLRAFLDGIFAYEPCNEIEHGIIENHRISLQAWKETLSPFAEKDVMLRTARVSTPMFGRIEWIKYVFAHLMGGGISGLCRKGSRGAAVTKAGAPLIERLACPDCLASGRESGVRETVEMLVCEACGNRFPRISGVVFLMQRDRMKDLYPEAAAIAVR